MSITNMVKQLWAAWKRIARKIGDFQARIILGIFYFVILAPFTLIIRSSDPLLIRKKSAPSTGFWINRPDSGRPSLEQATRQF